MCVNIKYLLQKAPHFSLTVINWLMLFYEIITVYCENRTKPINMFCGHYAELLTVKAGGTYTYHWDFKGLRSRGSCY
jgi:hypothetical protein